MFKKMFHLSRYVVHNTSNYCKNSISYFKNKNKYFLNTPMEITNRNFFMYHNIKNHLSLNQKNWKSSFTLLNLKSKIPLSNYIHTSSFKLKDTTAIPDYLIDSISEVTEVDYLQNEEENWKISENELEDVITDYLSSRCISYDETDSSFIVQCPSCSHDNDNLQSQDIFVDKHSGYYVCPWCCGAGTWEELGRLLDSRCDNLLESRLINLLESSTKVDSESCLKELSTLPVKLLQLYGCRINKEGTRLIVPVYNFPDSTDDGSTQQAGKTIGFYSVSLDDPLNKTTFRFLPDSCLIWSSSSLNTSASIQQRIVQQSNHSVIVVGDICEGLYLSQLGYSVITLPTGVTNANVENWGIPSNVKSIILWLTRGATLPYQFYSYLNRRDITCRAVSPAGDTPLYQRRLDTLTKRLSEELVPLFTERIMSATDLQEKIYHRILHKNEVHGIPWMRFPYLQSIMLGHRLGEVTVLSGSTGSGKTTFMAEYSLDLAQQGVVTLWASLEVSIVRLCEVLLQQYSGNPLPVDRNHFNSLVDHFKRIPLHFLDLHGQQDIKQIMQVLRESIVLLGTRHVIIDNLQFLVGCQESASERWLHQDRAMAAFRTFATQNNCHVTLIVHPRKLKDDERLTLQTVGGGARVTQEADNVMLLQVTGSGGGRGGIKKAIEIVKNRYGGHLGLVPLKFHPDSLTLSNYFRQNKKETNPKTIGDQRTQSKFLSNHKVTNDTKNIHSIINKNELVS